MPLYIKAGSILAMGEKMNYIDEKERDNIKIVSYLDEKTSENSYTLYEDDGISYDYQNGNYNLKSFSYKKENNKIEFEISYTHNNYKSDYNNYQLILKNIDFKPTEISFNGQKIEDWVYNLKESELSLKIKANEGNIVIM